ncbi:AraC family transcriptional regulator [Skermania sp. ID1734]|uniref:AraC family transcriptional regulator n=1 Tax=Skermania sp. ID1734 TaxID=2597516 RepID=UPI001180CB7C|nr:AraC family transcriptional regulator [Skermania sp. ID1734]TSD99955.1 AraC family transcriptional regulator [Skermania sp. ID1734]
MKPLARYASLANYVDVASKLGLDPTQLIRDCGLDPASIDLQDRWVPAAAIAEVLERSAAATERDDFGLALVERRRLSNLGPLSLVIREEPDVRSALRILMRYHRMYNEAVHARMIDRDGICSLMLSIDVGQPAQLRQSVDLAVGVLYRLLKDFLGPDWRPIAVSFSHAAPNHSDTYRRLFGAVARFDRGFDGISFPTSDLDAPNAMSDPLLRSYAQQFLESMAAPDSTTQHRVRELIELLLPTGRCSVDQVALSLGVDRRTVHRKLAAEGLTFSSLLDSTRAELAAHLVANRAHSLIEVSDMLAFSSPSNFSRWFKKQFGTSPKEWRLQNAR